MAKAPVWKTKVVDGRKITYAVTTRNGVRVVLIKK